MAMNKEKAGRTAQRHIDRSSGNTVRRTLSIRGREIPLPFKRKDRYEDIVLPAETVDAFKGRMEANLVFVKRAIKTSFDEAGAIRRIMYLGQRRFVNVRTYAVMTEWRREVLAKIADLEGLRDAQDDADAALDFDKQVRDLRDFLKTKMTEALEEAIEVSHPKYRRMERALSAAFRGAILVPTVTVGGPFAADVVGHVLHVDQGDQGGGGLEIVPGEKNEPPQVVYPTEIPVGPADTAQPSTTSEPMSRDDALDFK